MACGAYWKEYMVAVFTGRVAKSKALLSTFSDIRVERASSGMLREVRSFLDRSRFCIDLHPLRLISANLLPERLRLVRNSASVMSISSRSLSARLMSVMVSLFSITNLPIWLPKA